MSNFTEDQINVVCCDVSKKIKLRVTSAVAELKETLSHQGESLDHEENEKFLVDNDELESSQISFGTLKNFYEGLDNYLGIPHARTLQAMETEHLHKEDSNVEFETKNYGGIRTTPSQEWQFVNNPDASEGTPRPPDSFLSLPPRPFPDTSESGLSFCPFTLPCPFPNVEALSCRVMHRAPNCL